MKELTAGKPAKIILFFALPIWLGSLFQQLYSMIDTIIVGRYIGTDAIAAVGSTSYISALIINFMSGLTNGFAIITARHFGAENMERVRKTVGSTIVLGLSLSAVFTAAVLMLLDPFLRLLNTPDEIFSMADEYITIIIAGMTVTMLYNMASGVLRAIGDSVTPLIFLVISSLINIVLDILFISVFSMGTSGAAYATLISQFAAFVLCVIHILRKCPYLHLSKHDFLLEGAMVKEMMATGTSMGLMYSVVETGSLILQGAINLFGTAIITAHTAARKLSSLLMLPYSALGSACATYCSQNYGAGKYSRIGKGVKSAILISWVWSAIAIAAAFLISPALVRLITDTSDMTIIDTAAKYMKVNTPFYFVLGVLIVMRTSLQGLGQKIVPVLSSSIELLGKALAAWIAAPLLGYFGVMISEPIVWIFCTILLTSSYFGSKKLRKLRSLPDGAPLE